MTTPMTNFDGSRVGRVVSYIEGWLGDDRPTVALVLGSGLGGFGQDIEGMKQIPYREVGLPTPHVKGHAGILRFVSLGKQRALIFDGRVHYYEGHSMEDVVLGVRAAALVGAHTQIITCASGGIGMRRWWGPKLRFTPGQLALIGDHINLMGDNPLRGLDNEEHGTRFPDMGQCYDLGLRRLARWWALSRLGMDLPYVVHAAMPGPAYETPAEVQMAARMGANTLGMSTIPEVVALRHMGAKVIAITCISNHAAGVSRYPLSHPEVVAACARAAPGFRLLLTEIITHLPPV